MSYWPSVWSRWLDIGQVLFFASLWTETKSRSINSPKKDRGQYPAILTEQTWPIKDFLCSFKEIFSYGIQRVVPRGQDSSILNARAANHSARFGLSGPLTEHCSHIIKLRIIWLNSLFRILRWDCLPMRGNMELRVVFRKKTGVLLPLLTKLVWSRWLDIRPVLFLRVYGSQLRHGPHTRSITHLSARFKNDKNCVQ